MLVTLGDLVSEKSKIAEKQKEAIPHLLNCAATHPNAKIQYQKSGMILCLHSDGWYISTPKACSHVGGNFFL